VSSTADSPQAGDAAEPSGFLPDRIIHLHPTRLCNLACLHCYSASDPHHTDALDPVPLCDALGVLRGEGYMVVSPPLAEVVNPLVITDTGALKPIAYDFDDRFDVASVEGLSPDDLRRYKQLNLPELQELVGGALAGLRDRQDLVDWFDHLTRLSEAEVVGGRAGHSPTQHVQIAGGGGR
jgi:hypothetical protein